MKNFDWKFFLEPQANPDFFFFRNFFVLGLLEDTVSICRFSIAILTSFDLSTVSISIKFFLFRVSTCFKIKKINHWAIFWFFDWFRHIFSRMVSCKVNPIRAASFKQVSNLNSLSNKFKFRQDFSIFSKIIHLVVPIFDSF